MRLPAPLYRRNPNVYKNTFGHVLILAGSQQMLGAAALTSLAAMRTGAGMTTVGTPTSLNHILQKKISNVVMTLPLKETKEATISILAFSQIRKFYNKCNAIAIGPGLGSDPSTAKLILKIITTSPHPLVIDADALTAVSNNLNVLTKTKVSKILTPHPGEMARLIKTSRDNVERNRLKVAENFSKKYNCILLLKGSRTIVASPDGKIYINKTGNAGMATAGSGDVLTGMIAAFLAQGLSSFDAAKWGAYLHGRAGDLAAVKKTKTSLIASDIIESLPTALKSLK